MRSKKFALGISLSLSALACGIGVSDLSAKDSEKYHPKIDPANFQRTVDNPYFPLVPGTTYKLVEKAGRHVRDNIITVTHDTKVIQGVACIVVHDQVLEKGVVKEDTYDWYAQDKQGNVWYFGEDTKEFKPHGRVITEGSWEAGVDGAEPGFIMRGDPKVGERYFQEYYHGHAEDVCQVTALHASVQLPSGNYADCVTTKEWSLLEPGHENKWYARGVGVVREKSTSKEISTLVSVTHP